MSPIDQSIQIIRQEQQLIPAAVLAFHRSKDANKLLAAQMLQELAGTTELIEPVHEQLQADVSIRNPIKILDVMWQLRTSDRFATNPAGKQERIYQMKNAMTRYLADTGIMRYFRIRSDQWYNAYKDLTTTKAVIDFFGYWFPLWWEMALAIRDGFIQSETEAFRWERYRPVKFRWGKTTLERRAMIEAIDYWKQTDYRIDMFRME